MKKLLVIGLDGATWDLLSPLMRKGLLPNLKKLIEKGVYGNLESTLPPVTGPSWLSLATGKNPGKTGVFDFLNKNSAEPKLKPVSSKYYQKEVFWDYLSANGYQVGILAYPTLYPPYETNGFMVSGIGSPVDENITYPVDLIKEIEKISGGYELVVDYHKSKYDNVNLFLEDLNRVTDKQFKVVSHLLQTKNWDFFIYVCSSTDWIQHIMWRHIDKNHPMHDQKASPSYAKEFEKFFQKIDEFLSQFIKFNANLLIISDHGFGSQKQCFNLAKWLENKGYMVRKKASAGLKVEAKKKLLKTLAFINKRFNLIKFTPKVAKEKASRELSTSIADLIDFDKSAAYCLGHTIPFGGIYINPSIKGTSEYRIIKLKIMEELSKLSDETGKPLKIEIYDPEKVYRGEKLHLSPDIIFTINDWGCIILEEKFDKPLFEEKTFSPRHTGSHRMNGIFLAYGPDMKKGESVDAKIYDIAPTVLHMFDIPIPNDIDGRVLKEMFIGESDFAKKEIKYQIIDERERISKKIENLKSSDNI